MSGSIDVTKALALNVNADSSTTHQGQTHGHKGFLLSVSAARNLIADNPANADVLYPFLIGDRLLGSIPPLPDRWVIDFRSKDVISAETYTVPFRQVEKAVLPTREEAAVEEAKRNEAALSDNPKARVNHHHRNFLRHWWQLSYARGELMEQLHSLRRYIVCVRVTKRPVFEFISTSIHPNDSLQVFTLDDDYSFGILQSSTHWEWFTERCSTLTERFRYTSNTVYDSFPWPQSPTPAQTRGVAQAAVALRTIRRKLAIDNRISLRQLYRGLERPGDNPLKAAHSRLDDAVRAAYGMKKRDTPIEFLFELNQALAAQEREGQQPVGPGLPPCILDSSEFIGDDSVPWSENQRSA